MSQIQEGELSDRQLLASAAAEIYGMRRARDHLIPGRLVGEPAWDILLALYSEEPGKAPVTSVCQGSGVPTTTAMRWIGALEAEGLVALASSPQCASLALVSLTENGRVMVEQCLRAMLRVAK